MTGAILRAGKARDKATRSRINSKLRLVRFADREFASSEQGERTQVCMHSANVPTPISIREDFQLSVGLRRSMELCRLRFEFSAHGLSRPISTPAFRLQYKFTAIASLTVPSYHHWNSGGPGMSQCLSIELC